MKKSPGYWDSPLVSVQKIIIMGNVLIYSLVSSGYHWDSSQESNQEAYPLDHG